MKKGKITVVITIAIACFALMTIMFMQFKVVNETDITSIETMREEELRTELANWKEKYNEAEEQYEEKNAKIEEYKQNEQSTEESSKLVEQELEQVKQYLGKTDVQGQGITVTLYDKSSENYSITAEDLLVIVDYLKSAGAEAISINGERIINTSDIVYVNNSIIYVNQQRILAPYVINAIGNSAYLESTLIGNGGYVDELRKLGFTVEIEKSDKVKVPKYNKEITYKYMQ
ncbi:putative uncharacterized protein [Clostridium sp. CAG:575]|nr:putative uncharacterized protein [Clostridium sp. CAG:575]